MNLVSSHDSCRSLIFVFLGGWVLLSFSMAMLNRWMDGRRERREGGRFVGFFFGVLFAGLLIRKCSSFTGEVSKYGGKRGFLFPLLLCDAMPYSWL